VGRDKILTPRLPRWKHRAITGSVAIPYRYTATPSLSFGYTSWLSRDPIGYEGGINLYEYVHDDPLIKIDMKGLKEVNTGVSQCYEAGVWRHEYLIIDGTYYGLVPDSSKGFLGLWSKGVIDQGIHDGDCTPVMLDECKYDIGKFKDCLKKKVRESAPTYFFPFYVCWTWANNNVDNCKESAKK
jgi:RHS repeat-associated protein